jgi:hypothetical protein
MTLRITIAVAAVLAVPVAPAPAEPYHAPATFRGTDAPRGPHHAHYPTLTRTNRTQRRNGRAFLGLIRRAARTLFPTVAAAERLGYRKGPRAAYIGMELQRSRVRSPFVHYGSARYERDDRVLDPERPEALVYWQPRGMEPVLVGFMFRASALRPPPDPYGLGPLLSWHAHAACDPGPELGNPLQFPAVHCPSGIGHHGATQMTHAWLAKTLRAGYAGAVPVRELGILVPGIPTAYRNAPHGRHNHGGQDNHGPNAHHHHEVTLTAAQATVANAWAVSLVAPLGALLVLVRGPRRAAAASFLGILSLAGVAVAHAVELSTHVEDAPYLGVLFCGLIVACSGLAIALATAWRPRTTWAAAVTTSTAAIGAYAASRTIGLPQIADHVGDWGEPTAVAALACEVGVISLGLIALRTGTR